MHETITDIRNSTQASFPKAVIYPSVGNGQSTVMLNQGEIVGLLSERIKRKEISQSDVARALGVQPSRMTELFKHGTYQLSVDQAVKLVEAFELERPPVPRVAPVPVEVMRLVVLYVAEELGVSLSEKADLLRELTEDVRAFGEYVADPSKRERLDLAEEFFRVMRVRRPGRQEADRRENDPQKTK